MGEAKRRPMVSIIIPTYNRAHLVDRAIFSILRQTYTDYEIIVVDDGSNDNTREVVESFGDDRIRYIRHPENRGCSAARNVGIKMAKSEYIAFQDSDDEWLPEKLEKQVSLLNKSKNNIDAVYTAMWRNTNNTNFLVPQGFIRKKEGDIGDLIIEQNFIGIQTVLIHKRCFDQVGLFDERLYVASDWEMWIRVAQYYKFFFINEPLVISCQQPDSLTSSKFDLVRLKAIEMIFKKHYELYLKSHNAMRSICYLIGHIRCRLGDVKNGRKWLLKSFEWMPINIKYTALIVISLFGWDVYVRAIRLKQKLFSGREVGPIYFFLFK